MIYRECVLDVTAAMLKEQNKWTVSSLEKLNPSFMQLKYFFCSKNPKWPLVTWTNSLYSRSLFPRWRTVGGGRGGWADVFTLRSLLRLHCPGSHEWNANSSARKWEIFISFVAASAYACICIEVVQTCRFLAKNAWTRLYALVNLWTLIV